MGVAPYTTGPVITTGIIPHAGGGQTLATQLNYGLSAVAPIGAWSTGDSVQLPAAVAGQVINLIVQEAGMDDQHLLAIFAKKGTADTINGNANATQYDFVGVSTSAILPLSVTFMCQTSGAWITNVTAD